MKVQHLRKLIREEVESAITEAAKEAKSAPKSFEAFRSRVAKALKKADAPEELVDEVMDVGGESGEVVHALYQTWSEIEQDHGESEWDELVYDLVPDMVYELVSAFQNPMNYAPGSRRPKVNGEELQEKVVDALIGTSSKKGKKGKPKEDHETKVRDLANLALDVLEDLENEGAVANVHWDGKSPSVTYQVVSPDFATLVRDTAVGVADLEDTHKPGTFLDRVTGLSVTFGDGNAVIS